MSFFGTHLTVRSSQHKENAMNDYIRRMTDEARNYVQRDYESRVRPHLSATGDQPLHKSKEVAETLKALLELAYAVETVMKDEKHKV